MTKRNLALAAAAASLAVVPVAAQAAPVDRTVAPVEGENELRGNMILLALAAVAIVVGIILIADNGDDDSISA